MNETCKITTVRLFYVITCVRCSLKVYNELHTTGMEIIRSVGPFSQELSAICVFYAVSVDRGEKQT